MITLHPGDDTFTYLACPYSKLDDKQRDELYDNLLRILSILGRHIVCFSPIIHWHEVAKRYGVPSDADWHAHHNEVMMQCATSITIVEYAGWKESRGVAMERAYMRALRKAEYRLTWHDEQTLKVVDASGLHPMYFRADGFSQGTPF